MPCTGCSALHGVNSNKKKNNYWPVSLLAICRKFFECLLYNRLYKYFTDIELISSNQSGFKPGDLCINQLLSITRDIYQSFGNGFEVKDFFLDISKAFDKVLFINLFIIYRSYL